MKNFRLSFLLTIFIASCQGFVHEPTKTELSTPETFNYSKDSASLGNIPWWEFFNDSELNSLISEILKNNHGLETLWHRVNQTRAQSALAGVDNDPTLDLSLLRGRERVSSPRLTTTPTGLITRPGHDTRHIKGWSLASSWEIDLWGRIQSKLEASEFEFQASQEDVKAFYVTLSAQVASFYFDLIANRLRIDNLKIRIQKSHLTLKELRERWLQGNVPRAQVDEALNSLNALKSLESLHVQTQKNILIDLQILNGGQLPFQLSRREFHDKLPTLSPGLPADLLLNRPDLQAQHWRLKSADASTAEAVANRLPRLTLSASYGGTGEKFHDTLRADSIVWNILGNLTTPLIDGGRRKKTVEIKKYQHLEIFSKYKELLANALGEVEKNLVSTQETHTRFQTVQNQLDSLKKIENQLKRQWQQGLSSHQKVLAAEQNYYALKDEWIQSQHNLFSAHIQLARSLGGPWLNDYLKEGRP